jgi:hypothetical protein
MKMKSFSNPYFHAIIFKLSFPCIFHAWTKKKNTKPSSRMDARAESPSKRKKIPRQKEKNNKKKKKYQAQFAHGCEG